MAAKRKAKPFKVPRREDPWWRENFNTALEPNEENEFQHWLVRQSIRQGKDIGRDLGEYDVRGLFREIGQSGVDLKPGHGTDRFKKPNHPTFSDESIYHDTEAPDGSMWIGGSWGSDPLSGEGTYTPSKEMLQRTHNALLMKFYFDRVEPGVRLRLP